MIALRGALLLALAFGALVPAQELILLAPAIDALWSPEPGRLWAQAGERLVAWRAEDGDLAVSDGGPGAPPPFAEHLQRAEFFDVGPEDRACFVGRHQAWVSWSEEHQLAIQQPLFRESIVGPPLRLPLILGPSITMGRSVVLIPARPEAMLWSGQDASALSLHLDLEGRSELGWGLGDTMVVSTVMPHVLCGNIGTQGAWQLLVGTERQYAALSPLRSESSPAGPAPKLERFPLSPGPFDEEDGILDFPYEVPPLVADVDRDGTDDLVIADPSSGAAIIYPGQARGQDRGYVQGVILVGGLLIATWTGDFDGDGFADLVLLRSPKPGLLAQLSILREGQMSVEALFYRLEQGGLPRSPHHRRSFTIPIQIGISNRIREVRFPALVAPIRGPAMIVARPEQALEILPLRGDKSSREGAILPPGHALRPFSLARPHARNLAFGWVTPADGRVLHLKLPD